MLYKSHVIKTIAHFIPDMDFKITARSLKTKYIDII